MSVKQLCTLPSTALRTRRRPTSVKVTAYIKPESNGGRHLRSERQPRKENVPGNFYVDHTCIDCDTCRWMAPETYQRIGDMTAVTQQPTTEEQRQKALQALLSCPTFSIHATTEDGELAAARDSFPLLVSEATPSVFHLGHHDEQSYAATPYLIRCPAGNVMVDVPRFNPALARRLEALGGIKYMFLTHQDDVGDHAKWAQRFPGVIRIMHQSDVRTRQGTDKVERQLSGSGPWTLDDGETDIDIYHTPGHSPGCLCLHFKPEDCLFTGDSLAYSGSMGRLTVFRRYNWHSFSEQVQSMKQMQQLPWLHLLPGHGRRYHFISEQEKQDKFAALWKAEQV